MKYQRCLCWTRRTGTHWTGGGATDRRPEDNVAVAQKVSAAERRRAFAAALVEARNVRGFTQGELGSEVGLGQPAISAWEAGENQPEPEVVFAVEEALDLPPGHLSKHLGYMPPKSDGKATPGFEDVVMSDPLLDEQNKRAMVAMYRELTRGKKRRR